MAKTDFHLSAARSVETHNAVHSPGPPLNVTQLAHETAALAVLRAYGPAGLSMLTVEQGAAIVAKLLEPSSGVSEAAARPSRRRTQITNWETLLAYAKARYAGETRESFACVFLDKRNQVIAEEVMNQGTVDHAPVYPREVARRALQLDASAVILMHNHPSGDPTPSSADVDMTRQVVEALRPIRVTVHDHLVIGAYGIASLKALGLM